jgi:predicted RNase H-like nuclease
MRDGTPIAAGKKKSDGRKQRYDIVCMLFPDAKDRMAEYQSNRENVLDAYALLWTARRVQQHKQRGFPLESAIDQFGLTMQIVA